MMNPLVSVVVPVHNAGARLAACLDSLQAQTLHSIEFVLVLDCPTDGSDAVAEEYARRDSRFKLLRNTENLHIGFSRNVGIEAASGRYIGFSDHDDGCAPEMFERLYQAAEEAGAEVAVSDYYDETEQGTNRYSFPQENSSLFVAGMLRAALCAEWSRPNTCGYHNINPVWNLLCRRDFLQKHHLRFIDNQVNSMEDAQFNFQLWLHAPRVVYVPEAFYTHRTYGKNAYNDYHYRSLERTLPHLLGEAALLTEDGHRSLFAVGFLRRLYTGFRNELHFKGWHSTLHWLRRLRTHTEVKQWLRRVPRELLQRQRYSVQLFWYYLTR